MQIRAVRKVLGALVLGGLMASLSVGADAEQTLIQKARKIMPIAGDTSFLYAWLSDTQVVTWSTPDKPCWLYNLKTKTKKQVQRTDSRIQQAMQGWAKDFKQKLQWHRWGLARHSSPPHPLVKIPPANAFIEQAILSPTGEHIAWVLDVRLKQIPLSSDMIKKDSIFTDMAIMSSGRKSVQAWVVTRTIWLSRSDGMKLHSLGRVETYTEAVSQPKELAIAWLPSGKKLSFVYRNMLYTILVH